MGSGQIIYNIYGNIFTFSYTYMNSVYDKGYFRPLKEK